jgi:antirestriction protein ArdC
MLSTEEKAQRASALRAMLEEAKAAYAADPEQRARYDRALAAVTNLDGRPYSLANIMLLEKQATARGMTLTRLGAFASWLAHGRRVRKGEKGLMAYAPHPRREDESEEERTGFHVVHLFDESQTEPIPAEVPA